MSEWIKLHAAVFTHPKTRRMAKRLGIPAAAAAGHMASLWCWALEFAPDGDLSRFDEEEIEVAAGWEGPEQQFIAAATTVGYLDRLSDGEHAETHIHDWSEWGGGIVAYRTRERQRAAERRAAERASGSVHTASGGRTQDVQRPSGGRTQAEKRREEKRREEKEPPLPPQPVETVEKVSEGRRIDLTKGLAALVDDEDYDRVSQHNWYAVLNKDTTYAATKINAEVVLMHRFVMGLGIDWDGRDVHHKNRNGIDNRKANLEVVTRAEHLRIHGGLPKKEQAPQEDQPLEALRHHPTCDGTPCDVRTLRVGMRSQVAEIVDAENAGKLYDPATAIHKALGGMAGYICAACSRASAGPGVTQADREPLCRRALREYIEEVLAFHREKPIHSLPAFLRARYARMTEAPVSDNIYAELRALERKGANGHGEPQWVGDVLSVPPPRAQHRRAAKTRDPE